MHRLIASTPRLIRLSRHFTQLQCSVQLTTGRSISTTAAAESSDGDGQSAEHKRLGVTTPVDGHWGTHYGLDGIPDFVPEHMRDEVANYTGLERAEFLAVLEGDPDPFNIDTQSSGSGTLDDPIMVPSLTNERVVGCGCEEGNSSYQWFVIYENKMRRCHDCGTCFLLFRGTTRMPLIPNI